MSRWTAFGVLALVVAIAAGGGAGAQSAGYGVAPAASAGTAFTYQGRLTDGGSPASGSYDFQFTLFDAPSGGAQVGPVVERAGQALDDGRFTVALDFGAVFDGSARYLDIAVRKSGTAGYTTLSPRQPLTPAPMALYTASSGALRGRSVSASAPAVGQVLKWDGGQWAPAADATGGAGGASYSAGAGLTLSGSTFALDTAYTDQRYWKIGGNSGIAAGSSTLGTNDSVALDLKVGGARVLRLEPYVSSPNLIGGYFANNVASGVVGATIGGGGSARSGALAPNSVAGSYGTVGGGASNVAGGTTGSFATVSGGISNNASGNYATISGGEHNNALANGALVGGGAVNSARGSFAAIGGGNNNTASGIFTVVGGGGNNTASTDYALVGGGYTNVAGGQFAAIGGGYGNAASAQFTVVGGGQSNTATVDYATIGGGGGNNVTGTGAAVGGGAANSGRGVYSVVGGGSNNSASGDYALVDGGSKNSTNAQFATVGGGTLNSAGALSATVAGGTSNRVTDNYGTVGGGTNNQAGNGDAEPTNTHYSTVAGGLSNTASGSRSAVGGGEGNVASGWGATVAGGTFNTARGTLSFVAGHRANDGNRTGSFVFADNSSEKDFLSVNDNEFAARVVGGARLITAVDANGNPTSGAILPSGSGSWSVLSDRAAKTDFAPIDPRAVLGAVERLPVQTWSYTAQGSGIRHIGPTAQDFTAAFGVGEDARHISAVDADGVALAAIQGLAGELRDRDATIARQQQAIDQLSARLDALERGAPAAGSSLVPWLAAAIFALGAATTAALALATRRAGGARCDG